MDTHSTIYHLSTNILSLTGMLSTFCDFLFFINIVSQYTYVSYPTVVKHCSCSVVPPRTKIKGVIRYCDSRPHLKRQGGQWYFPNFVFAQCQTHPFFTTSYRSGLQDVQIWRRPNVLDRNSVQGVAEEPRLYQSSHISMSLDVLDFHTIQL